MSDSRRPVVRTSIARLAVAGAASLATVFSLAPVALAADEPTTSDPAQTAESAEPTETEESTPPPPAAEEDEKQDEKPPAETTVEEPEVETPTPDDSDEEVPAEEEKPEETPAEEEKPEDTQPDEKDEDDEAAYLAQSFRVSARLDPGGFYPDDTETTGSRFSIAVTDGDGATTTTECTTDTASKGDSTFCSGSSTGFDDELSFDLAPGSSAEITQLPYEDGSFLTADPVSQTIEPQAVEPVSTILGRAAALSALPGKPTSTQDLVFTATGVAPTATTYEESVDSVDGDPIIIDPLAADPVDDPDTVLAITQQPARGTAKLIDRPVTSNVARAAAVEQVIEYTPPAEDYDGPDSFTYSLTNANGTSSGTVNVDVQGTVVPSFGSQKYRVGVRIADGAYVSPGVTTVGSVFVITETGQDGQSDSFECTANIGSLDGSSFCFTGGLGFGFEAEPGDTVTVVQKSAPEGLVKSDETLTLPPCEVGTCNTFLGENLIFTDTGLLPDTSPDSASTTEGDAVTIDVLANDDSEDPQTELGVADQPGDGKAVVVGDPAPAPDPEPELPPIIGDPRDATAAAVAGAGTLAIRYTPRAGFTGTDTFEYDVSNSNGTSTETVTVRVRGGQVEDTDVDDDGEVSGDSASSGDANGVLPDTGGVDGRLLGLAGLLMAAGAAAVGRGRRRSERVG